MKLKDHIRKYFGVLLMIALLAIVPIGMARHMISQSREDMLLNEPNYLAHQMPPSGEVELTPRLERLLDEKLRAVDAVPRTFLAQLPDTLPEIEDAKRRKKMFISSLLPLVLRANELIIEDRGRLLTIRDRVEREGAAGKRQRQWLQQMARRYRVKISDPVTLNEIDTLLFRADVIPPSLALAQAAMETGWGTSYFAQEGNALFGEWTWTQENGILPRGREDGKTHKIKSFEYLLDSIISYMTNLNRHNSYKSLRERRAELREHRLMLTGPALAPSLASYSERGHDYVNDILSIIDYNDLDGLDSASLITDSIESR